MLAAWTRDIIARRPALPAAIAFIFGIILHAYLPHLPAVWLMGLALLTASALARARSTTSCSLLLAAGLVCGGVACTQLDHFCYPIDHIGNFAGDEPRLAWVQAEVTRMPLASDTGALAHRGPGTQTFTAEAQAVESTGGWIHASGSMLVSVSPPQPALAVGDVVRLFGMVGRPAPAMNPGGMDAAAQDRRRRLLTTLHVTRPFDVHVVSSAPAWRAPWEAVRARARRLLDDGFTPAQRDDRALLGALVFGDRTPDVRPIEDDFSHAGVAHLFSSNGTRIAILAACVYLLGRLLRLRPAWTVVLVTLAIAAFGCLTMPAAQAIRPVVVCAAAGLALAGRRTADSLQLLAMTAIALLVWSPMDLYAPGFQLAFVIVLGLIVLAPRLARWARARLDDPDRAIADALAPPGTWSRLARAARWRLLQATVAALVAWAMAVPLVAVHFEQFNPWTVPFSLALAPLAVVATVAGFAKLALTAACPPAAFAWAAAAQAPAWALRHGAAWLAHAPLADVPVAAPPVWQVLLYYALLCAPLVRCPRAGLRWCARLAPLGGCGMLALPLCGIAAAPSAPWSGAALPDVRVTLLYVGAGQCAVVEPRDGPAVLLDAGSSTFADPLRICIAPFLRHERLRTVESVWLSHGDFDHISAARQLVPNYGVSTVFTSPHFREHARESKPCEALLESLDRSHHSPRLVAAGDGTELGGGVRIDVLWPPTDCPMNSNNAGLVLRLTAAGRSILFPADIQEPAERALLKHPEQLRADVLVAPHHGSSETTTPDFLRAVAPRAIVSSSDGRLTMKQRLFEKEVEGRPAYRTSRYGAIIIDVDSDGTIRIASFREGLLFVLPAGQ